jgi:hypothetical protein
MLGKGVEIRGPAESAKMRLRVFLRAFITLQAILSLCAGLQGCTTVYYAEDDIHPGPEQLRLTVTPGKPVYRLGEEIVLEVQLENLSNEAVYYFEETFGSMASFYFRHEYDTSAWEMRGFIALDFEDWVAVRLAPNAVKKDVFTFSNKDYYMPEVAGTYEVFMTAKNRIRRVTHFDVFVRNDDRLTKVNDITLWTGTIKSNIATFRIE